MRTRTTQMLRVDTRRGRRRHGRIRSSKEPCGIHHNHSTQDKMSSRMESEKVKREKSGYYNAQGCRKAFENVVGVFHDNGDQESSNCLIAHHRPREEIVALKYTALKNAIVIIDEHGKE